MNLIPLPILLRQITGQQKAYKKTAVKIAEALGFTPHMLGDVPCIDQDDSALVERITAHVQKPAKAPKPEVVPGVTREEFQQLESLVLSVAVQVDKLLLLAKSSNPIPELETLQPILPPEAPAPRKPRVVVIGLYKDQFAAATKEIKDLYDLIHVERIDRAARGLPTKADAVFLMTKFIDHSVSDAAIKQFGKERIHLCTGAGTRLRAQILEEVSCATGS